MTVPVLEFVPAELNIKVYRGDTIRATEFTYKEGGVAVNISAGYSIAAQIRLRQDDPTILKSFTVVITDGVAGKFTIFMAAADTAALPPKTLYWDLQVTSPSGHVRTFVKGKVTVSKDVTRV